ncbi:hypothetical protein EDB80DRAFT_872329 [Ilyonectria destructans]|nr:hypothetical protein EDB80DRAFT_872329 [Ilyonectria destructans]
MAPENMNPRGEIPPPDAPTEQTKRWISDGGSRRSLDAAEGDTENDIVDPSEEAYKAILEETVFFYQMLESFILSSGNHTTNLYITLSKKYKADKSKGKKTSSEILQGALHPKSQTLRLKA